MKTYIFGGIALSLLLAACRQPVPADRIINRKAAVPAAFGLDSLGVITTTINKRQHTMSTLYGNVLAVKRARSGAGIQAGEKLVLVTWKQKPDENWFGANIPAEVQRIEQVTTLAGPASYRRFDGPSLALHTDTTAQSKRINAIFGMQASMMP